MATRLYNQRQQTFTGFTPPTASNGTWGSDLLVCYPMDPTATAIDDASGFLTRTVATSASAATICHAIFISPPMQTTHDWTSATCIWTTRCSEAFTTQNVFQQFYWGIISNDGATMEAFSALEKGATEFSTSLVSRTRTDAGGGAGVAYTNVPGDRLYIEVGWDKDAAVSGDVSIQYGYSDTAGDLLGDGDAGVQNSWVEFSHTVTFDPEGTVYGSTPLRMLMGIGT